MAGEGIWQERLDDLTAHLQKEIAAGLYYGASLRIARHGDICFDETLGTVDGAGATPLKKDAVFSIFSVTKAFINVLILRAIERGQLTLTTKVVDIIPEFAGPPRDRATYYHLLTHTAGMPGVWEAKPGMLGDRLSDLVEAVCQNVWGVIEPGERCDYSPVVNHVLLGETLRRLDAKGRAFRDILREDLFEPLGMKDTSMGVRRDLASRHAVPDLRGSIPITQPGRTKPGPYGLFEEEEAEMPHVGCVSTVEDLWRFAEMLRRGGEFDAKRILSPQSLRLARQNRTGEEPNELYRWLALSSGWKPYPAYIGLGFALRGTQIIPHQMGNLTSPETFGNDGAGSSLYWVDPELDATFVCLTTGVMHQARNVERFNRLSNMAVSALI